MVTIERCMRIQIGKNCLRHCIPCKHSICITFIQMLYKSFVLTGYYTRRMREEEPDYGSLTK